LQYIGKTIFFPATVIIKILISSGLTQANSANQVSRRYLCVKNNDLLS
jgi:hypothetical protein